MSKGKLIGIGLAGVLSAVSVLGKAEKQVEGEPAQAKQVQKAEVSRQKDGRENIALSYVARDKDYVKSINCLLSLYQQVIPFVRKNAEKMGIGPAMHQAFVSCRQQGVMKENSVAYNFDDIVIKNYAGKNLKEWEEKFEKAGLEAQKILKEGDKISRVWVPLPLTGKSFVRRDMVENTWQTAEEFETWNNIRKYHDIGMKM